MFDDLNTALVRAHRVDLERAARAQRLVRLATGCKPSALRVRTGQLVTWFRSGIGDRAVGPVAGRECCA
jgi:hypothetical protein